MRRFNSQIVFEPWHSDAFYKQGIEGRKILVLGESLYHSCEKDLVCRESMSNAFKSIYHRGLTQKVVMSWRDWKGRSPLSCRVPQLFRESKGEFWNRVVFYNYLQDFAGEEARDRPNDALWANDERNAAAFQEVLDHFEPDRILVLGKKLWTNLPSKSPPLFRSPSQEQRLPVSNDVRSYNADERICYWYYSSSGHPALAMPIMHPVSVRFSLNEWVKPVSDWLAFDR
jgi:hypothetical protein